MERQQLIKELHPLEIRVLLHFKQEDSISSERLQRELGYKQGQSNQAFAWLEAKRLIEETERTRVTEYSITDLGIEYRDTGTPEERLFKLVQSEGPCRLPEAAGKLGLENKEVGSAFGAAAGWGLLAMDEQKQVVCKDESKQEELHKRQDLLSLFGDPTPKPEKDLSPEQKSLIQSLSRKRGADKGMFRVIEREQVAYRLTKSGLQVAGQLRRAGVSGEEIGQITPEILRRGEWKNASFRSYNINTPPQRVLLGRKNPYVEFLEGLKDKLNSLGFEEFDGPLLETEFWNCDALFMPQFHAARDIHDVYYIKNPTHARAIEQPYLDQVAACHEDGWDTGSLGWRYPFDRNFTRRLILRSQGTVLSAKTLPRAKVPGRYFGVVRCFRYDKVDATHLADFYQTEGIALGEKVNLKTLLGLLKMFAVEVAGAQEYRFVPGYFPFTEPSVEIHIRHPKLGWFELGGSGIFRPEVTKPLGIEVPVAAWGLGIDRMALVALGLNDLRDLFTPDIEQVRLRRRR
jgi:phenylalanyl-tRNA synthetase alpha chain